MSVAGGRVKVQVALKDLLAKWDLVRQHWNDDVARAFQDHTLDPLEGQVRAAITAMEKMRESLYRVKSECGPRSD
ncbi:MAG: hypothetical protein U0572_10290 [Phycisphaerales bacterium]